MIQTFRAELRNMEVRKVEEVDLEINDKIYKSLAVSFDDENFDRLIFKDKDISNINKYKRGDIGTLVLNISTDSVIKTSKNGKPYNAEKTVITIRDWLPDSEK